MSILEGATIEYETNNLNKLCHIQTKQNQLKM